MKLSLSLTGVFLAVSLVLSATVYTVSNDPAKPAQYNSPATALAAASNGDTLYIYGSPSSYGAFTINKNVTLIGAGNNTRKDFFYKTVFDALILSGSLLNGVTIDGVFCQYLYVSSGGALIQYSNITIRNSIVSTSFEAPGGIGPACGSLFSNWLMENSFVNSFSIPLNGGCSPASPVVSGFVVRNSVIGQWTRGYNLLVLNSQCGTDGSTFNGMRDNVFNNCIFYRQFFNQNSTNTNNQFNNCLTYLTQSPNAGFDLNSWTGGATGSANNCIINQNPLWVTAPANSFFNSLQPFVRNGWSPDIQVSSPARNAGTDGTDIGLTGGLLPYNFRAEPSIPVIRKYQLVNAVVPPSGTVTIQATATKAQ